jgi:outer membrane protein TolC
VRRGIQDASLADCALLLDVSRGIVAGAYSQALRWNGEHKALTWRRMKIRWIPEFDYTRAKEKVAPSEKEKTMQRMRIRMQHGNTLMLARPSSESVGRSSGRALRIDRLCTLMLLVLATTASWAQVVSPNLGSVPSGPAISEVLRLTLSEAISRAMRYNLGVIESDENTKSARGQRLIALSNLLPQLSAGINENVDQVNFTALGLGAVKVPGIPAVAGPFSYSTASASLRQTLFSYESIQRFRAARTAEQAAQLSYKDTLDVITLTVGNAYLQVIEARSRIEAEEAQVQNAKALYDQAVDEFQAGTSPRIDETRTEVQLHTEQYNLSVARNNFEVAKLSLGRAIGLPLGQAFEIADQLPYADLNPPTVEDALKTAYNSRSDFRSALGSAKSAEQALSAAKGQRYPVVAVNGDYGDQGPTFGQSHGIFSFQAGVNLPIFTGGRIKGDITQAEAALRQRKAEAENIRGQIDYDVRTAFLNLNAAKEQVDVAHQNVDLANDNVARSKERFAAGVTDSVEVVQSEQSLASANDQYLTSLYSHNFAKLALARALGVARTNFSQYLGGR